MPKPATTPPEAVRAAFQIIGKFRNEGKAADWSPEPPEAYRNAAKTGRRGIAKDEKGNLIHGPVADGRIHRPGSSCPAEQGHVFQPEPETNA